MDPGFYGVASIAAAVGDGVTGSRFCTLDGIVKTAGTQAPYQVANEYVASKLAGLLGLPVPPGTIVQLDDKTMAFAMMKFGQKGDKPPPVDPEEFVTGHPQLAAGIVLFDAWIINGDRHAGNLAWYPGGQGSVSIFDHGHALFGTVADKGIDHLANHAADPCLGYGCLIGELTGSADVEAWVERIDAVRDSAIRDICQPLKGLGVCTHEESVKLGDVLVSRRKAMRSLVTGDREKFKKIKEEDWGLKI